MKNFFHNPIKHMYLYVDAWFNFAFGTKNNPLYHLGSLAFFLLWIVLVSGLYVFVVFDTSITGAFQSVEAMTEQWYLAGIMRSLHRYASDAVIAVVLLHIIREFSLDRYRGFRWFSWFTGTPNLWLMILLGISGYWLVWDQLAQYVAIGSSQLLDALPIFSGAMSRNFLSGNLSDRFFTLMAFVHLLGLPVMLVFGLWIHVKRLTKVEVIVPRGLAIGSFLALLILSLIKPAVSHEQADLSIVPSVLNLDWFYLNVYPLLDYFTPGETLILAVAISSLLMIMPWLPTKRTPPAVVVDLNHCNGCSQCFEDCPFDAISMQARTDGARWDMEPIVDPALCAACGICVGSCPYSNPSRRSETRLATGIDLPDQPIHQIRTATKTVLTELSSSKVKIVIFGCNHGIDLTEINAPDIATITLPCTGMLPPAFIDYTLRHGADSVLISGCRSQDCYYRFGNHWLEKRIKGERTPILNKRVNREHFEFVGYAEIDKIQLLKNIETIRQRILNEGQS
ncbi:hydrogenase iron-sulfur subunit [Candidatus Halobeggiatoa sp. HSG11]|nr:hydrogenase iron-sulfur subunit [Candidatus Halobeggiatoa sp. HSG11]